MYVFRPFVRVIIRVPPRSSFVLCRLFSLDGGGNRIRQNVVDCAPLTQNMATDTSTTIVVATTGAATCGLAYVMGTILGERGPPFELTVIAAGITIICGSISSYIEGCMWIQITAFTGTIAGIGIGSGGMAWWKRRDRRYQMTGQDAPDVPTSEIVRESFVIEAEEDTENEVSKLTAL